MNVENGVGIAGSVLGRAQLYEKPGPGQPLLIADILETLYHLFQAPAPHRSLFIPPTVAAGQHVDLAIPLHQFHLDLLACLAPGPVGKDCSRCVSRPRGAPTR